MLHILWMIVKFILIVLGILLGLLLLALLLILFCPVRYGGQVSKRQEDEWKKIRAEGKISWLFGVIALTVNKEADDPEIHFRVFGIPVDRLFSKKEKKPASKERRKRVPEEKQKPAPEKHRKQISEEKQKSVSEEHRVSETKPVTEAASIPKQKEIISEEAVETKKTSSRFNIGGLFQRIRDKLTEIRSKIQKIKLTIQNIRVTMNWWKAFLENERVQAAISLVWRHARFLIRHILPTKTEGHVTFSSEDPAVTGVVLAVLGMTIPFHKNCVEITPLFEGENIFQGHVRMKGRIYGVVLLRAAIEIYFNKNVKYVIYRWKHKEG